MSSAFNNRPTVSWRQRKTWLWTLSQGLFVSVPVMAVLSCRLCLAVPQQDSTNEIAAKKEAAQRLATDRKVIVTLESFYDQLNSGDTSRALDDFRRLKTADPYSLVPTSGNPEIYVPLYQALFRAAFELPSESRKLVTGTLSNAAENSLRTALSAGQPELFPRLIQESAGTVASIKAHFVLARLHMNRGNFLAAENWLRPLTLKNVDAEYRDAAIQILKRIHTADTGKKPAELSPKPPGQSPEPTIPQHLIWQSRPAMSPKLRKQIAIFLEAAHDAKVAPQSTWQDLLGDNVTYRRTLRGVAAVDLSTGSTSWEYPVGTGLDGAITANRGNTGVFSRLTANAGLSSSFPRIEQSLLANTFCRDNSLGRLAADTDHLYLVVAEGKLPTTPSFNRGLRSPDTGLSFTGSKLVSIQKQSGRRVWSLGRGTFEEKLGKDPKGCWIAGPPQPAGRYLFCVFEWKDLVRLGCVLAQTGELVWSTGLAYPEQSIDKDSVRRLWGATPHRNSGLIWCPTTTGWLTCVDEITQSIVYATAIQSDSAIPNRLSVGRGQPVVFTHSAPLTARWSVSRLLSVNDRLVVFPHESHDIVVMESSTGKLLQRIAVAKGSVVVFADSERIVLGAVDRFRCLNTSTGTELWSCQLSKDDGFATGQGVNDEQYLLVPMSTGAIARLDLNSGAIVDRAEAAIPTYGWGQLARRPELNGDILYLAPDRISRISATRPDAAPRNPVELASGMMSAGKWQEALEMAQTVPETDPARSEAESISFQCRLQLAAYQPDVHLANLRKSALHEEQLVQVQVLEASVSLNQKRYQKAAEQLTAILQLSPSLLKLPAPQIAALSTGHNDTDRWGKAAIADVSQPLLTWAATNLDDSLEQVSDAESVVRKLSEVSPTVLLSVHHPAVQPVLHDRIRKSESLESAMHLLRHSIDLQTRLGQDSAEDFTVAVVLLTDLFRKLDDGDGESAAPKRQLLNAACLELPENFLTAFRATESRSQLLQDVRSVTSQLRRDLATQYALWTEQSYQAIPVTRMSSTTRNSVMLAITELDDPFLQQYQWSAIRGDYGRIRANSMADPAAQWSIPGNFQVYGTYSNRNDLLQRLGTVLLLRTFQGLTAISPLDQKVIWTRTLSTQSGITIGGNQHQNFDRFMAGRNPLPSRQMYAPYHVVGFGQRWVCIKHASQIEVIDSLSGQPLWSAEIPSSYSKVVATDDVVLASSNLPEEVLCFDRRSGQPMTIKDDTDLCASAIRNVGELIVRWNTGEDGQPHRLTWVNPLTSIVEMEVSLDGLQRFHFLDDRTLVGINNEEFQLVDLVDGTTQQCSFHVPGRDASASPPVNTDGNGPPDLPFWDPGRVQVNADALNYYVSNHPGNRAGPVRQPLGRQMARFEGGLRAVDRSTGKIRWWIENDVALLATTDQPELAVLLLIDDSPNPAIIGNAMASRNIFRGIAKLNGSELFKQAIPSQYGVRYLWVTSPVPNTLDIGVQGMRVRLEGQTTPQGVPEK